MDELLTIEEKQRFWHAIDGFEQTSKKLDEMYTVIVGNDKFGQEGLVHRIQTVEDKVSEIEKTIDKVKSWIAVAVFVGGIIGSVITLIVKSIF